MTDGFFEMASGCSVPLGAFVPWWLVKDIMNHEDTKCTKKHKGFQGLPTEIKRYRHRERSVAIPSGCCYPEIASLCLPAAGRFAMTDGFFEDGFWLLSAAWCFCALVVSKL
jgi:hypothetical protein